MKKVRKSSVFKYTLLNVFGINIVGAFSFFIVVLIVLSIGVRNFRNDFKTEITRGISSFLDSSYIVIKNFEEQFKKSIEKVLSDPAKADDFNGLLELYENVFPFIEVDYKESVEMNNMDTNIKNKIEPLGVNEFFIEKRFEPDCVEYIVYVREEKGVSIITMNYKTKQILENIVPKLKNKAEFLGDIQLFNHEFEPLTSSTELSLEDRQNLEKVFKSEEPVFVKIDDNKFRIYALWRDEDETGMISNPIGIILTAVVGSFWDSLPGFFL